MKKPIYLLTFMFAVIVILLMVRVAIVNSISTTGSELVGLQNEIQRYKKQNALLREEYLKKSALTTIENNAKKLGFVESKTQIYLSAPIPLALKQ